MFTRHDLPLHEPFLPGLARRLLDLCGERLPRARVVLPSTRACASLRHALLEASGADGLLLPATGTPADLVSDLADRLGLAPPAPVPADLRAAVLTPALAGEDWLRDRPGAAPGLAAELVRLFDELRRHGLDPAAVDDAGPGAAELQARDAARIRSAWALYRARVPRDAVDLEAEAAAAAEAAPAWPGAPVGDLVVAGISDLTPLSARLLRAAARGAEAAHHVAGAPGDHPLTRLYLAAFGDADAPTHPLIPERIAAARLDGDDPVPAGRDARPYRTRIEGLGDPSAILAPGGEPLLRPCADAEQESRVVADLVVRRLREDPRARIAVATADRRLARRVADQLVDAGLDLDVTDGTPLASHADGRLLRSLQRTALTDGRADALLELLTHPLVDFGRERGAHRRRVLSFEKDLLRGRMTGAGLDELRARAERRDADLRAALPAAEPEMTGLMDDLEAALAGLRALASGPPAPLRDHLDALRGAWALAAPDDPLAAPDDPDDPASRPARRALLRLLDDLASVTDLLPPLGAPAFADLLARRLGEVRWWPNRSSHLPVQVTGLLEARLETFDLLVVAGLGEGVFPDAPARRTLLLGRAWRERHGLPDWRWDLGLDAELFLRLLHNGRRTVLTWSRERDGQPALPSTLVGRLELALPEPPAPAPVPPLWRPDAAPVPVPPAGDDARRRHAPTRSLARLSYSALRTWLACPYRWLLERGYGLREPEPVLEELRKKDYGSVIHDVMRRFLDPEGPGPRALADGDRAAARAALVESSRGAFTARVESPSRRRLWRGAFLALVDALVDVELDRARAGRAVGREAPFAFTLAELRDWVAGQGTPVPDLAPEVAAVVCEGRLDRVDLDRDGATAHVIDYKTGAPPAARAVAEGEDLQLPLYALAVRLGRVAGVPADATVDGHYYGLVPGRVGCDPARPALRPDHDLARDGLAVLEAARGMADRGRDVDLIPDDLDPDAASAPCRHCAWRGACRIDERPAPDREAAP